VSETFPSVRLSPKARKRVRVSSGTARTVTPKLQVALAPAPSVAVHATAVLPDGKVAPLAGVHVTVTAPLPPDDEGGENVTGTCAPLGDDTSTLAGQVSDNGRGPGGGDVGELPQPARTSESVTTREAARRLKGSMIETGFT